MEKKSCLTEAIIVIVIVSFYCYLKIFIVRNNKFITLPSLLEKLLSKVTKALPGIISSTVFWILNRGKEAMGWLPQNLLALLLGGLI